MNNWELCPKCQGEGVIIRINQSVTNFNTTQTCNVCNGKGIINKLTGNPSK